MGAAGAPTSGLTPPLPPAVSYIDLPAKGDKKAPPTFKGSHRDWERFIEHYIHICAKIKLTDDREKCLGLLQYCSVRVADYIENLEEYVSKDFDALIKKLAWQYDSERKKGEYHIGHIEEFTRTWREERISDLKTFKKYHRKYLEVAGPLKRAGRIDNKHLNRSFWEGLNQTTRDRLERRMTDDEPSLDLAVPFPMEKVIRAAEHIFNRNRFDKHLWEERKAPRRSTKKKTSTDRRRRRPVDSDDSESDSEDESDTESDSESEEEPVPSRKKSKGAEKTKVPPISARKSDAIEKKAEADEIGDLVKKMEGLRLDAPLYRSYYVQLSIRAPKICSYFQEPRVASVRSYATQDTRSQSNEPMRRDPPPHQSVSFSDQRMGERRELTCYGCGAKGHRMDQCARLDALINQGHVRRIMGKLRWSNGSFITREPEEPWVDAISRGLPTNQATTGTEDKGKAREVLFVEIGREESDADTEAQEEMGWRSGSASVHHLESYGAERSTKVSREARNRGPTNSPPRSQRVKELPVRRNSEGSDRKKFPVSKNPRLDQGQDRFQVAAEPTPFDVSPAKFEGKLDSEFVPMDVEEVLLKKPIDDGGKLSMRHPEGLARKVIQSRPKGGKTQSDVVKGLMEQELTLRLQDIIAISPTVRKNLVAALRAMRDDLPEDIGREPTVGEEGLKKTSMEEGRVSRVLRSEVARDIPTIVHLREAKAELLRIEVTMGKVTMPGVVDTGSMISLISTDLWEKSGLPSMPLDGMSFPVIGVSGKSTRCRSWVPGATLYLTENRRPTNTNVFVLDEVNCSLILGRPWMRKNWVCILERPRGTYVRWEDKEGEHEITAWRDPDARPPLANESDVEVHQASELLGEEDDEEYEGNVDLVQALTVRAGREGTDRSYIPDSELDRVELEEVEDVVEEEGGRSEDTKEVEETKRRARRKVDSWREEEAGYGDDEKEDEDKEEGEWSPPPNQLDKGKGRWQEESLAELRAGPSRSREVVHVRDRRVVVDRDLEERMTSLVQREADEQEWDDFCRRERKRLAKRDREWADWVERYRGEEDSHRFEFLGDSELLNTPEKSSIGPWEPSQTLRTHPEISPNPVKRRRVEEERPASIEVMGKRSQRIRHATTCSNQGEIPKDLSRTYQRREQVSRTVTTSTRTVPVPSPSGEGDDVRVFSMCLFADPGSDDPERVNRRPTGTGEVNQQIELRSRMRTHLTPEGMDFDDLRGPSPAMVDVPQVRPATLEPVEEPPQPSANNQSKPRKKSVKPRPHPIYVPTPTRFMQERPAVPVDTAADERWEDSEVSIIEPVRDLISAREERGVERGLRTRKPRPDSGVIPRWEKPQGPRPYARGEGTGSPVQKVVPYRMGPNPEERVGGQWVPRDEPTPFEARLRILPNPGSAPRPFGYEWRPPDLPTPHLPVIPLRAPEPPVIPLVNAYQEQEREISSMEEDVGEGQEGEMRNRERPLPRVIRRMPRFQVLRSELPKDLTRKGTEAILDKEERLVDWKVNRDGMFVDSPEEYVLEPPGSFPSEEKSADLETSRRPQDSKSCRKEESCGEPEISIKAKEEERRQPHRPSWLSKVLSDLLKPAQRQLILSVLILLAISFPYLLALRLLPLLQQTMRSPPIGDNGHPMPRFPRYPIEINGEEPINAEEWTIEEEAHLGEDVPRLVMSTLRAPPADRRTPGIFAMSHIVPLYTGPSHAVREYLGLATTGSILSTTGRIIRYRADVHIRIFPRNEGMGWEDVPCPSRTEVDALRGILFREGPFGDTMRQIKVTHKDTITHLPFFGPGGYRLKGWKSVPGREDWERRVPPNTPASEMKIGPPRKPKKTGAPKPFVKSEFGILTEDETREEFGKWEGVPEDSKEMVVVKAKSREPDEVEVKEEEDEDLPFRLGLLLRTDVEKVVTGESEVRTTTEPRAPTFTQPDKDIVRPKEDVLVGVVSVLAELRRELASSIDLETSRLINEVETNAGRLLELKESKDKDGDVVMVNERGEGDLVPAYRPSSTDIAKMEDGLYVPKSPLKSQLDEIRDGLDRVTGESRDLEWRMNGVESRAEERMLAIETRLAVLEALHTESGEGWTIVKPPKPRTRARGGYNHRGSWQKVETEVEELKETIDELQAFVKRTEETLKEWNPIPGRVDELERRTTEGGERMEAIEKRVVADALGNRDLEKEVKEVRLRLDLTLREVAGGRSLVGAGLLPRVIKLEERFSEIAYRLETSELLSEWIDQKILAVWMAILAQDPAEACVRAAMVRLAWLCAAEAQRQRAEGTPRSNRSPSQSAVRSNNPFILVNPPSQN